MSIIRIVDADIPHGIAVIRHLVVALDMACESDAGTVECNE